MAIEGKRGCGYRKVGGLYLVGSGIGVACDRLPYVLTVCPCCGAGIKQARGFTWINGAQFFKTSHDVELENADSKKACICASGCPICQPRDEKYGLLWVGEKYYTPQSFVEEAMRMGISKRISQMPKDLKLGETWILVAHPKAKLVPASEATVYQKINELKTIGGKLFEEVPAIFYAFKPQRIEKIITDKQATKTALKKLEKRGITPVVVPHDDPDHNPGKRGK